MKTIFCLLFCLSTCISLFAQKDTIENLISSEQDWRIIARNDSTTNSWFYNPDKIWIKSKDVFTCEIKFIKHYPGEDPNTIAKNFYRLEFNKKNKTVKIVSVKGEVPATLPKFVKQSIISNCYRETKTPFFHRSKSPF